jgi:hypothetical protein
VRQRGLGQEECPGQVDCQDFVPFVVGHLGHGLVDRDAGIVDQDVQAAMEIDDLLDRASTVIRAPDIALMDDLGVASRPDSGEELAPFGFCRTPPLPWHLDSQGFTIAALVRGCHLHESDAPTSLSPDLPPIGIRRSPRP